MHSTVVLDSYKAHDADAVAAALDKICHPDDNHGWASEGVYCFFDTAARSALYLGLAEDLASRFRQHNGLAPCPDDSCKRQKVLNHFSQSDTLGFGIFLQSCLDQGQVRRNGRGQRSLDGYGQGRANAAYSEGRLIEAYRMATGSLPPWNEVGGSLRGRGAACAQDMTMVKALAGDVQSPLVARRTLRALAGDDSAVLQELTLHIARFAFQWMMLSFEDGLEFAVRCGGSPVSDVYLTSTLTLGG